MYKIDQVVARIKVVLKVRVENAFCGHSPSYNSEQVLKGTSEKR